MDAELDGLGSNFIPFRAVGNWAKQNLPEPYEARHEGCCTTGSEMARKEGKVQETVQY